MRILNLHNEINKTFKTSNKIDDEKFVLKINDKKFSFPRECYVGQPNHGYLSPDQWLHEEHLDSSLHEPGLVITLLTLSEIFNGKKIKFIDIGALYGYFSVLAYGLFGDAEIISVEGNPKSCKYIENVKQINKMEKLSVINAFVQNRKNGKINFYVYGYKFLGKFDFYVVFLKNFLKKILNYFVSDYFISVPLKCQIETTEVSDLLDDDTKLFIVKIDTEGYQATFLPDASSALIEKKAIILLEFDDLKVLKDFESSNAQICKPFLDNGYNIFWIDHRNKGAKLYHLETIDRSKEINSLGILIPKELNDFIL